MMQAITHWAPEITYSMWISQTLFKLLYFYLFSYQKPRVEYFLQSMRADRSAFNYSTQQNSLTEMGSAGFKRLTSEGGKAVRYSYRSVQRMRNSRRSQQAGPRRYTTPVVENEDTTPLVNEESVSFITPRGRYGTVTSLN